MSSLKYLFTLASFCFDIMKALKRFRNTFVF